MNFRVNSMALIVLAFTLSCSPVWAASKVEIIPDNVYLKQDEVFTVQVRLGATDAKVFAAEIHLKFDPQVLRPINPQTKATVSKAVLGNFFSGMNRFVAVNSVDSTEGKIEFAATFLGRNSGKDSGGNVISISFLPNLNETTEIIIESATLVDNTLEVMDIDLQPSVVIVAEKVSADLPVQNDNTGQDTAIPSNAVIPTTQPETPNEGHLTIAPETETANVTTFSDLQGHWASETVQKMEQRGLIRGFSDGTFRPNIPITRAEFTVILVRAVNPAETHKEAPFNDVKSNHWASKDIARAAVAGLVRGSNNLLKPNEKITRAEVAVILSRLLKKNELLEVDKVFNDNDSIPEWAKPGVITSYNAEIITGFPDGTFRPGQGATRAETAAILLRFIVRDSN